MCVKYRYQCSVAARDYQCYENCFKGMCIKTCLSGSICLCGHLIAVWSLEALNNLDFSTAEGRAWILAEVPAAVSVRCLVPSSGCGDE